MTDCSRALMFAITPFNTCKTKTVFSLDARSSISLSTTTLCGESCFVLETHASLPQIRAHPAMFYLFQPDVFGLLCNLRSVFQARPLQCLDVELILARYTSFNRHVCLSFVQIQHLLLCKDVLHWSEWELLFSAFRSQQTLKIANAERFHFRGPAFDCGPWCAVVWKPWKILKRGKMTADAV